MIVIASSGYFPWTLDFIDNETFEQMVQRLRDENSLQFRSAWSIQDTHDGRVIDPSETVSDERRYHLTAWITPVLTTS